MTSMTVMPTTVFWNTWPANSTRTSRASAVAVIASRVSVEMD
jgi:hypothetical protein